MTSEKTLTPMVRNRAEEKRILSMASVLDKGLNGKAVDELTLAEVKSLLRYAELLASAVLHVDTTITVDDT